MGTTKTIHPTRMCGIGLGEQHHHPSKQLEYASAEIDKRTAFANFLPSINANANHSWNIGLNQNITTGLLENVTTQFSSAGINMGVDVYGGSKTLTSCTALIWLYWSPVSIGWYSDDISLLVAMGIYKSCSIKKFWCTKAQLAVSNNDLSDQKLIAWRYWLLRITSNWSDYRTQEQAVVQAENNYV